LENPRLKLEIPRLNKVGNSKNKVGIFKIIKLEIPIKVENSKIKV
jgi:hypothetical protein